MFGQLPRGLPRLQAIADSIHEAYLGKRWVQLDATQMSPIDDLVRVATGRDAKDVAFATIYGPATMLTLAPLITKVSTTG